MPYKAKVVHNLNGLGPYVVPFPMLDPSHLRADYDAQTFTPDFNEATGEVTLTVMPVTTSVVLRRETPTHPGAIVDFVNRSTLTDLQLDLILKHALYVSEELSDRLLDVSVGSGGSFSVVQGNTYWSDEFPSGVIQVGATLFKTNEGNKIYRWDGGTWVDVQKVLDLADFGTGVKPIRVVLSLPGTGTTNEVVVYGGRLYVWSGSAWVNKVASADIIGQIVTAQIAAGAIDASKFPNDLYPVKTVTSLPANNNDTDLVLLTTDWKVYRWNGTGWTSMVPASDLSGVLLSHQIGANAITAGKIAAGAVATDNLQAGSVDVNKLAANSVTAEKIVAGAVTTEAISVGALTADHIGVNAVTAAKIAAGAVTASKVGANEIITQAANIADAVIGDAKIANLSAGKISTGNMQTQYLSIASGLYDPSFPARYFKGVIYDTAFADNHNYGTGTAWGFNHPTPLVFYTQGHASGTPILYRDSLGKALISFSGRIFGYAGVMTCYARINDAGAWIPLGAVDSPDGGNFGVSQFFRYLSDLPVDAKISLYVAPCDGNGNIAQANLTTRYELDVLCHNWR
jgi:hypothetical protein